MKNLVVAFLLALASVQVIANTTELNEAFTKANELYSSGDYQSALDNYNKILDAGFESSSLYYNIGNSHYKAGNIPFAILYFEKALKLDPSNEDIRFNLKLANMKIVDKPDKLPELPIKEWWNDLVLSQSHETWAWSTIYTLFISVLLLGGFLFAGKITLKKLLFYSGMTAIFFSIFFFTVGFQQIDILANSNYSIIIDPSLTVFSSPNESGTKLFTIHEGTKVKELENISSWVKIKLANGNVGWVKGSALEKI